MMVVQRLILGCVLCLALCPAVAQAQRVAGKVTDATSKAPIAEVELQAILNGNVVAHAITDRTGSYTLALPHDGGILVRATRLGYATEVSKIIDVPPRATATHDIELRPTPVPGDSIVVRTDAGLERGAVAFSRRCAIGVGICLTPDVIAKREPHLVTDLFRGVEGIAVRQSAASGEPAIVSMQGYGCLLVFLDHQVHPIKHYDRTRTLGSAILGGRGALQNTQSTRNAGLNVLDPATIRGIEVYRGFHEVPKELLRTIRGPSMFSCGVAIVWTTVAW